jgi:hypothetical protein
VDVAALAIAIAIDPQSLAPHVAKAPAPPPEAPPSAPTAVSILPPAPEADLEPARPVASSSPLAFDASAGVVVSGGLAPAPAVGGALGALIRWHRTSLGLEGRIDAPAARTAQGGGSLSSQLTVGTMLVCLHAGRLFGCALGQAGAANDQSEGVLAARSQSTLWLGAGARVGVDVPLQRTLALRVHTDFVGDLNARRLRLNDRDAWVAPVAAVSLGADALVHF